MVWIAESDDWGAGPSILAAEVLERIRRALDETPVIVEHWFYRGSSAPERLVFDDFENFRRYLGHAWNPGDAFHVWRFDTSCRQGDELASGKLPDDRGRVPKGGAY